METLSAPQSKEPKYPPSGHLSWRSLTTHRRARLDAGMSIRIARRTRQKNKGHRFAKPACASSLREPRHSTSLIGGEHTQASTYLPRVALPLEDSRASNLDPTKQNPQDPTDSPQKLNRLPGN